MLPSPSLCTYNVVSHTDVHARPGKREPLHAVIAAAVDQQVCNSASSSTIHSHVLFSDRRHPALGPKVRMPQRLAITPKAALMRWCFVTVLRPSSTYPSLKTPSAQTPLPQVNSPQIQTRSYGRSRRRSCPKTNIHTRSTPYRVLCCVSFLSKRVEKRLSLRQRRNGRRQYDEFTATIVTTLHSTLQLYR